MPRPRLCRRIKIKPTITYFKPRGVCLNDLDIVSLSLEEIEALRLRNIEELEQEAAAKKMNTSQSTYQRILSSAYKKITEALVQGKAIEIINNK
ncbi:MAG: hypothetical protein A2Y82_01505 [Candidatus Buchananbacteria bacterium RBG_13_36_9]|uniref:UPF0251 protein A2Y82_01505 n=1 Tax=Candidatus Buchananbacteria bacterium RBG_13_36_9 TaxID=1797530 RepID=A0A1G1XP05_9BACT|nr:MAG: hypothetical protein A2Y82_01505 [Candidatus Buchananbacteria bacterium RBG_13_36_9]